MGKHTIYLNQKLEDEIRDLATKEGWSLTDIIRKRLENASRQDRYHQKVESLENKVDAIYALLDLLAGEIGYTAGATRASTRTYGDIVREGLLSESYLKSTASALKKNFEVLPNVDSQVEV